MKETSIGMNKTGAGARPLKSKETVEGAKKYSPDFVSQSDLFNQIRREAMQEAGPIGTTPPPAKLKGAVKTGMKALKGGDLAVFIDKLGERLAFERTGARLYEAVIEKCELFGFGKVNFSVDTLKRYHREEVEHFQMLVECLESLGADPTCMTPSADVAGLAATGHLKVIVEPRTSVAASIQSLLALELLDNDCWGLLIELAKNLDEDEMAQKFQKAFAQEQEHLKGIRALHTELVKSDESSPMDILQ